MARRFTFWGFKSSREILENSLGSLERDVMASVWARGEASVRAACDSLGASLAYTTVMTTMDRLFKKGLLKRRKVGRAFVYAATVSKRELEEAVAAELLTSLLDRGGSAPLPVLSTLVNAVSDTDRELLDELERLIREKRQSMNGGRKP